MGHQTRILEVDAQAPTSGAIEEAAEVLRRGGLVAFATETVYGLGADATDPAGVARIFEAKGRPPTNPLIVHVDGVPLARTCVAEWTEAADALADAFWPGPLTLVLPRAAIIPRVVAAGLETVGVRVPAPQVALQLIARVGRPLAAPSANRSNGISPTMASHVLKDLGGKIDLLLDSGPTTSGLESTVLDLTTREPRVLRPGPVTVEELEHVLGARVREAQDPAQAVPSSPGQMAVHYAPRTPAIRVDTPADLEELPWPGSSALLVVGEHDVPALPRSILPFHLTTPADAAHRLYALLHQLDGMGLNRIVVLPPPDRPEWRAVRDRLWRATEPSTGRGQDED
jgi:L-threonylcarbamoyladenylate synthase